MFFAVILNINVQTAPHAVKSLRVDMVAVQFVMVFAVVMGTIAVL